MPDVPSLEACIAGFSVSPEDYKRHFIQAPSIFVIGLLGMHAWVKEVGKDTVDFFLTVYLLPAG